MGRLWMILVTCLTAAAVFGEPGGGEPVTPIRPSGHLDAAKVALGRKLFHDPRLSRGDAVACSTCHQLQSGGADGRVRSLGSDGWPLEFNTPTVFNVSGNARLNWKGNFRTLEEQNESVLRNTRIMNADWDELLSKLRNDSDYLNDFSVIYGSSPARVHVLDALATFERSLVTPNSRFDRRLRGESGAISPEEEQGYQLFKSYGCVACHQGANFGGNLSQPFGIFDDPFNPRGAAGAGQDRLAATEAEGGATAGIERGQLYRVPSLRNVAVTAPYFHNGYTSSLAAAVEIMGRSQLGRELSKDDVRLIVQFLNTLTGEYEGRPLAGSDSAAK
jgi:cytochrome c peroxidase